MVLHFIPVFKLVTNTWAIIGENNRLLLRQGTNVFLVSDWIYINLIMLGPKNNFAVSKFSLYTFCYIQVSSLWKWMDAWPGPANHFELRYHFAIALLFITNFYCISIDYRFRFKLVYILNTGILLFFSLIDVSYLSVGYSVNYEDVQEIYHFK